MAAIAARPSQKLAGNRDGAMSYDVPDGDEETGWWVRGLPALE